MRADGLSVRHPLFARFYGRVSPLEDRAGFADRRRQLLAGLRGRVVEVGAGNGLNFAHYPPEVTRVLAVEPEAHLRRLARRQADKAPVLVEVVDGVAQALPAGDASVDAAVASLVLCSVSDQPVALAELHRVIRPGGELRFVEHVRAATPTLRLAQRVLDATVWPTLVGGCHTSRDTIAAITAAGFDVQSSDRFRFPDFRVPLPTTPHVVGVGVRP